MLKKLIVSSYFVRLVFSFLALATITLVLSTVVIYKNYESETIKEYEAVSEQMLSQTVYGVDLIWDWASKHAIELYNNGYVFNAIYSSDLTPVDEMKAQTILTYAMSSNPYIYSIYLYNSSMDKMYSTISKGYFTKDFFDQDILSIMKDQSQYTKYHFIPRKIKFVHFAKKYEEDVISLIVKEPLAENRQLTKGALVLNIKVNTINNLIESYIPSKGSIFVIFNDNDRIISHTDTNMFMKQISDESYVSLIKASKRNSWYFTDTLEGRKYLITFVKSDKLKWSFVLLKPYNSLFEKTDGMRTLIITLVLIVFLIIVFFSFWLSLKFYKPYNKAVESANSLKKQYTNNKDVLRREFLRSLLNGELPYYNYVLHKLVELDIQLGEGSFVVLLLSIDHYTTDCLIRNNENDMAISKFAIGNIAKEIVSSAFMCEHVDMGPDMVALIFNSLSLMDTDLYEIISKKVSEINKVVEERFKVAINGTIGRSVKSLIELDSSYRVALEISEYRLLFGTGVLLTYDMVKKNIDQPEYSYPDDLENEIVHYMKLWDSAALEAKTNEFFDILQKISYDDILMSLNRLLYSSIKTMNSFYGRKNPRLNYKASWDRLESMDTLDDMRKWILEQYKLAFDNGNEVLDNVKKKHMDRALQIIQTEYSDQNLCSDSIAQKLGLSSSYIREMFRESMGVSMSNYINELRCNKASEMLLDTSLSITEIIDRTGIGNQNYFFTLFKKFKGMTPQKYRNRGKDEK